MTEEQRAVRVAELRELRRSDPNEVLALYRRLAGMGPASLPDKATFRQIIQTIVDKEAERKAEPLPGPTRRGKPK